MRKPRKNYTPVEKVAILRRHLIDHVPVSDLCDEHRLSPTLFYLWQKQFFENGPAAFERKNGTPDSHLQRTIAALRDKLLRKNEVVAELMEKHIKLKKRSWGTLNGVWVPHDTRDSIVDFVRHWAQRTEIPAQRFIGWLGIAASKFHDWRVRYGLVNEHNALVPRDWWLEPWEKTAILEFHRAHPLEGYRRLAFMMLDADVVAASPASVYRVLLQAGAIKSRHHKPSKKGKGFQQPLRAHEHWHVDITYINVAGSFFYLCSLLDGYSRFIVHWEIRESMTELDVETIIQRARERFPGERPRIISDNGPQFIARDFKEFVRICGMTHVRTSPCDPNSNSKMKRWYETRKGECIRVKTPLSLADARRVVEVFVAHSNGVRLPSAIGYVAPADKLAGRDRQIVADRDRKLETARERRKAARAASRAGAATDAGPPVAQPMGGPWNERDPDGG